MLALSPEGAARLEGERSLLRWGGLAGLAGGVIMIATILYQVVVLGTQTTAAGDGPIIRFPSVQTQIAVGQSLFLVGTILLVGVIVTLSRNLRGSSLSGALFGGTTSLLGLAVLAVEGEPNVAMAQISAQYHAAGATAAQQASAVVAWQATQGMFNEFDTCAYILLSVGFILLGAAMLRDPKFGQALGRASAVFGIVGLIGVSAFSVTSAAFAIPALLTFVVFPLLFGGKLYRLAGARSVHVETRAQGQ